VGVEGVFADEVRWLISRAGRRSGGAAVAGESEARGRGFWLEVSGEERETVRKNTFCLTPLSGFSVMLP
jgi:hypothetical protein